MPTRSGWRLNWRWLYAMLLIGAIRLFFSAETAPPTARYSQPDQPFGQQHAVSRERLAEIESRIQYTRRPDAHAGSSWVDYQVFLNPSGAVIGQRRINGSNDPALDAAVVAAIRATAPFPANTESSFDFWYSTVPPKLH